MDPTVALSPWDMDGPGDAHPVLFLHAAAWTRKMWLMQTEAMCGEFRTIAIDLPGHGTRAATRFTLESAQREVERAVLGAAGGRALIVGLSMGGYAAIAFAQQHPEMVAGLVLSGCSVDAEGAGPWFLATVHRQFLKLWGKEWLPKTHSNNLRQLLPPEEAERQIAAGFYFQAYGDALLEMHEKGFHARIQDYPGPVLILNGELDTPNRKAERELKAHCARGRVLIVPQSGQLCNLQNPHAFTGAVVDFARSLEW